MSKSEDNLSALFRSLGPDDSSFQAAETAASKEATQRWPLFQAVSPSKLPTTPSLSDQERARWSQQEKPLGAGRKPALSLPGLSDKLAESLGRMAGPRSDSPVKVVAKRAQPLSSPRPAMPVIREERVQLEPTVAAPVVRESDRPVASPEPEFHPPDLAGEVTAETPPLDVRPVPPVVIRADNSLSGIFNRLAEKPGTVKKSIDTKSSFLTRLGKR